MTQLFISYSRKDQEFAQRLATSLAQLGFDIWMDTEDIAVGSKWSAAIQHGLDHSALMILVLSAASMESPNVEDEFTYFLDQKKPIIPVLWKPTKVHFQLGRVQYIDFYAQSYDTGLAQVLAEVKKRTTDVPAPKPMPAPTSKQDRLPVAPVKPPSQPNRPLVPTSLDSTPPDRASLSKVGNLPATDPFDKPTPVGISAKQLAAPGNRLPLIAAALGILIVVLAGALVLGLRNQTDP
ncbi:MAG: toll/interleukin-1 receptor domain-containing protein, partial [Armatimonadetes bacterium]|nr:toll/interleukin-1 receptor domain-containing protein [Anaerolineae bacterium]